MKTNQKEIIIEIPEGMEIDKENSTFERIVFKEKVEKFPNWNNLTSKISGWYINTSSEIKYVENLEFNPDTCKNIWPTKELAEASLALSQLVNLRKKCVGDWKCNWNNSESYKAVIKRSYTNIVYRTNTNTMYIDMHQYGVLSFPSYIMANYFMVKYSDLLEIAKILI